MNYKLICIFIFSVATSELIVTPNEFILLGNSTHFETFDDISLHLPGVSEGLVCELTKLELNYVNVDRDVLLSFLENCANLETIILNEIGWHWNKFSTNKVHLPNLLYFQFNNNTNLWNSAHDLESIIFFYINSSIPTTGLAPLTSFDDFDIEGNFVNEGYLFFNKTHIVAENIKDLNIWKLLQEIWNDFELFKAIQCSLDVASLDMKFMKTVWLDGNELRNGKVADILKSAKVAEDVQILSFEDEALDVSLLPTQTLRSLETKQLSFRWSSTNRPVLFPQLRNLEIIEGDIDLNLFLITNQFASLNLAHVYLWNSTIEDIGVKMSNLEHLSVQCELQEGICPHVLLDSLPKHLKELTLSGVELSTNSLEISFDRLTVLILHNCNFKEILSNNFHKIFPKLEQIDTTIGDVVTPGKIDRSFDTISYLTVRVPFGTRLKEWSLFKERVKVIMNISDLPYPNGTSTIIHFEKDKDAWVCDNTKPEYAPHEFTRMAMIMNRFGISMEEVTQHTLDVLYYCYSAIVYTICAGGIACNSLSVAVFMRKSMRSSTSCLLLGLAICDILYLLTALLTVEEFQLLFSTKPQRSTFNGHFAYPLNKTAYAGSVYMTILITVGRFVAICFPLRLSFTFTMEKTIRYILGVLLMAVLLNLPRWFEFIRWNYEASSPFWSGHFPRQLHKYPIYQLVYQKGIWYLTIYAIPFLSIAILNLFMGIQARKSAKEIRCVVTNTNHQSPEKKLTKVLLTVVFVFFICNALSASINWIFISKGIEPEVAEVFACLPIIINSSVNFILYCLIGNYFRKEFKLMLKSVWNYRCKESSNHNTGQRDRQATAAETRFRCF